MATGFHSWWEKIKLRMTLKLRSWWEQIKQHLVTILVVAIIVVVAIALIIVGYRFDWTGFNGNNKSGKTLWDWMQLLFIPVVLAVAGFWFNHREREAAELRAEAEREIEQKRAKTESDIAVDNQRETALQAYIDNMSELLLHEKLWDSVEDDEVRKIARVRTLTILPRLDGKRKGTVLQFLQESNLIVRDKPIVDLNAADLSHVELKLTNPSRYKLQRPNLSHIDLRGADLSHADLQWANLSSTDLSGANLQEASLWLADLSEANLSGANLRGVDLNGAMLSGTNLRYTNLEKADLSGSCLKGADLRSARLSDADLRDTDLSDANLSKINSKTIEELEKKARSLKGAIMPDGSKYP